MEEEKKAPKKVNIFDGDASDDEDENGKPSGQVRRGAVTKNMSSEISMLKPTIQRRQRQTVAAKSKKYDFDSD